MILALSLLTACGGDSNSGGGGNNNGDSGNNSTPGGSNNSGGDSSAVGYPDYWDDTVPKMNGTVTFHLQMGTNVNVNLDVKSISTINDYIKSLENDGYEKHIDKTDDTDRDVALKNGTWNIHFSYNHTVSDNDRVVILKYSPDIS